MKARSTTKLKSGPCLTEESAVIMTGKICHVCFLRIFPKNEFL